MRNGCFCLVLVAALLAAPPAAPAASSGEREDGTVSGTITVHRTKVKTSGSKSYRDVVVYLELADGGEYPALADKPVLDQKGLVFLPHVMVVQKGMMVEFRNSDNDDHNVYFLNDETGEQLDLGTWEPGDSREHSFEATGTMITLCKLHLDMAAYLVVLETPYFTTAVIDGETQEASYTIENVPAGNYVLKAWHKKLKLRGGSHEVTVAGGEAVTLDIEISKAKYTK